MPPGESHGLGQELPRGDRSCRIVGIVQPENLRALRHLRRDGAEVRQEAPRRGQRHAVRLAAGEERAGLIDGVGGIRHQDHVAGVDKRQGKMADALLGSDQSQDLGGRIQRDAETCPVPVGRRFAEREHPLIGGILVVLGIGRGRSQGLDDVGGRRQVGIPDSETDDVHPFLHLLLLHPVQLGEQVARIVGPGARLGVALRISAHPHGSVLFGDQ